MEDKTLNRKRWFKVDRIFTKHKFKRAWTQQWTASPNSRWTQLWPHSIASSFSPSKAARIAFEIQVQEVDKGFGDEFQNEAWKKKMIC